jgi:hypothetical protein
MKAAPCIPGLGLEPHLDSRTAAEKAQEKLARLPSVEQFFLERQKDCPRFSYSILCTFLDEDLPKLKAFAGRMEREGYHSYKPTPSGDRSFWVMRMEKPCARPTLEEFTRLNMDLSEKALGAGMDFGMGA